jgi:hypothetical protein
LLIYAIGWFVIMIMRRLALPPRLGLLARRVSTAPAATRAVLVLSEEERRVKLEPLAALGWTLNRTNESIEKTFRFSNFLRLWGFATQIAMETHKMNHHAQILVVSGCSPSLSK